MMPTIKQGNTLKVYYEDCQETTYEGWELHLECECGNSESHPADEQRSHLQHFAFLELKGKQMYECPECGAVCFDDDVETEKQIVSLVVTTTYAYKVEVEIPEGEDPQDFCNIVECEPDDYLSWGESTAPEWLLSAKVDATLCTTTSKTNVKDT